MEVLKYGVIFQNTRFIYKEPLHKEPTCRRPKNQGTCTTEEEISKELFNFEYFYHCKQPRIRKPFFIHCSPARMNCV